MKWSFQKVTAMIVGLAIFLLGGWIMNLVKLVNGGDLQFDAGNGRNQAKFTFKGLCFAAVKLIAAGKITASAIEYEPCREHVEREMKESKRLH
ncbi:hypothetical protein CVE53_20455 [Salmonella enterica]|uniref:hypothetical protein n=1 Tax=Citrobacter freundii TaxID=546 RepID=UPI0012779FAA|nr:hypothetical protein [Citrobacter freundii]EAN5798730.1 hypothetical protein [Salmonella enterica]EBD4719590.1 hypothetical protein [Salmonella enterica]EDS0222273.1 hypothetical protein [Salmonella enterica]MDQ9168669.1 hypothetical protein [Citrobacter freundii]